ncbi:hypothetical protein GUJ93_ZPchr0013g37124 [Zizania palustris]|uniref:Uncharacterized protein n=1 Tax=Zizania palustris TaxID=103762 RepID=A0A8J5X248_ZIZPA|nr:hypothetical protein GUJ93_ZPchr0013g37124 [Zizania palustris]
MGTAPAAGTCPWWRRARWDKIWLSPTARRSPPPISANLRRFLNALALIGGACEQALRGVAAWREEESQ